MTTKAKRRLSNMDFSGETAAIALVHKDQGGPANLSPKALILKAVNPVADISKEIQKAQVQVTMSFQEFLRKFFGMYSEDALVLARLLGMEEVPPEVEEVEYEDYYENYINERVASFNIMKALHESTDLEKAVAELDQKDFLLVLQEQAKVEKALAAYDKKKAKKTTPKPKTKEENMTTETVEKSQLESIQKALEDTKNALQAAQEEIAKAKADQKALILKARNEALAEVIKDEKHLAVISKAVDLVESNETFVEILDVLKALITAKEAVEKSQLLNELGGNGEVSKSENDAVARILKAKFHSKTK